MNHYKEKVVPESIAKVLVKTTCDLCQEEISSGCYQTDDVDISRRWGDSYPESGSGEQIEVDLCGKCFSEKLIPWLESEGADIETKKWDY